MVCAESSGNSALEKVSLGRYQIFTLLRETLDQLELFGDFAALLGDI
jgi:hypothetical protein